MTRIGIVAGVIIIVIASVFFGFRKAMRATDDEAPAGKPVVPAQPPSMSAPASSRPTAKGTPLEEARPLRRIDRESRKLLVEELARARAKRAAVPVAGSAPAAETELSPDYILTQTLAIKPLLSECYTEAQRQDPALAGQLRIEIVIGGEPDVGGLVESSRILDEGTTIKDAALHECIRETMYGLELVAPAEGGRVTSHISLAFSPDR